MGLLRAFSTRRGGYDKLLDETTNKNSCVTDQNNYNIPVLKRAISVPARVGRVLFGSSSRKVNSSSSYSSSSSSSATSCSANNNRKQEEIKKKEGKVHPVFGLFDGRSWSKRKFTANPDFSRYVEYMKEGGVMRNNMNNNNKTVLHNNYSA